MFPMLRLLWLADPVYGAESRERIRLFWLAYSVDGAESGLVVACC
jgi:hypothetical protein